MMAQSEEITIENQIPVQPVVSPDVIHFSSQTSVRQTEPTTPNFATSDLTPEEWMQFASGLFLGFMLTLGSSSFAALFSPCLQQRAIMTSSAYFFYQYMELYMDGAFVDQEVMGMMILYFVQFGIAKDMGQCGKDEHGFENSGLNKRSDLADVFTLDFDDRELSSFASNTSSNPFYNFITKALSVFGQSSAD